MTTKTTMRASEAVLQASATGQAVAYIMEENGNELYYTSAAAAGAR